MVSGSQHEHLPLGLITVWLWAAVATAYALMTPRRASLAGWSLSVAGLWLGTLLVGLFAPLLVTGSDPTRIPLAVLLAPPMAAVLTGMLSLREAGRQLDDKP
jgi:hypothetical protein